MSLRCFVFAFVIALGQGVAAQDADQDLEDLKDDVDRVATGTGAVLRGLDKLTGETMDLDLSDGDVTTVGRLRVELRECRYPEGDPAREAYAYITVRDDDGENASVLFQGWMVASSPALNAMEHFRYDVWVLRCKTNEGS